MNKSNISVFLIFSIIRLLTSSSVFQNESTALEFKFDGDNGFHFDLGKIPGNGGQGPPGEQGPKGEKDDKGDTGAQGQGIEHGQVIVFVHVTDNTGEGYVASDIPIVIISNNQTQIHFKVLKQVLM